MSKNSGAIYLTVSSCLSAATGLDHLDTSWDVMILENILACLWVAIAEMTAWGQSRVQKTRREFTALVHSKTTFAFMCWCVRRLKALVDTN